MKKILIISNNALGDCVPSIIAIAKNLAKNSKIFCIVSTNNQYNFLREIPFFYSVIQSNNNFPYLKNFFENPQKFFNLHLEKFLDLSKQFCLFDEVYITRLPQYYIFKENIDPSFLKNVVAPLESNQKRPADRMKRNIDLFGFSDTDISVDINFYKKYYFDFKCTKKTVLFNPKSNDERRSYKRENEVVKILTDLGFDVRQFDMNVDIRTNLHLINQAPLILTTDTSNSPVIIFGVMKKLKNC